MSSTPTAAPAGLLPVIGTFTVTPPTGGGTMANVYGCEDIKLADREMKKDTYTMISGTLAGLEQILLGTQKAGTIEAKMCFETDNYLALDALTGVNGSAIALSINKSALEPGISIAATGGIEKIAFERWEDGKHAVYSVTIAVNAGWTAALVTA